MMAMLDDDALAEQYAAADQRVSLFRELAQRAAADGRLRAFFRYCGACARAMNARAAIVEAACLSTARQESVRLPAA